MREVEFERQNEDKREKMHRASREVDFGKGRERGEREGEIKGRANTAKGQKLWDKDGGRAPR